MSGLQEHTERAERKRKSKPPRDYIQPDRLLLSFVFGCTECGALVHDTGAHDRWHEGLAA